MGELDRAKKLIENSLRRVPNDLAYGVFPTLGAIPIEQGKRTLAFEAFRDAFRRTWMDEDGSVTTQAFSIWHEPMTASGTPEQVIATYDGWLSHPKATARDKTG